MKGNPLFYDETSSWVDHLPQLPVRFSHVVLSTGPKRLPEPLKVQSRLRIEPISRGDARAYVRVWHRTHGRKLPAADMARFAVSADADEEIHGVALLGLPVSRMLAKRGWLEITRVASDGTPNACSALLGACAREARWRGAPVVVTYTLEDEPGTSLRAAGFEDDGLTAGGAWDSPSRPRAERVDIEDVRKRRWIRRLR